MSLVERIKQIIQEEGELKAREITTILSRTYRKQVVKSEINSILYGYENVYFQVSKDFKWRLIYGNGETGAENPPVY